jgi:hypothetical protein
MKIQVTEMVKKEVEITTPCYVKSQMGYSYYHVIDDKTAIQIFSGYEAGYSIGMLSASIAFQEGYKIIQAKEYKEVFNNVLKALSL